MNFKDKKILITGATGGIGSCLVDKFYELGGTIVATGTREEKLKELKNKYPKIHIEKFKLDEHGKIESFIEKQWSEYNQITNSETSKNRVYKIEYSPILTVPNKKPWEAAI